MRIGVMLRHVKQQRGGIRTYTNNLLEHLVKLDTVNEYIFIYHDEDSTGSYSVYPNVEEIVVGSPSRLTWDQIAMISVVRRKQLDLIFNPKLSIPLFADCQKIFVLHGGDWFTFPKTTRYSTDSTTVLLCQYTAKRQIPSYQYPTALPNI
jgi:hypothetical protein